MKPTENFLKRGWEEKRIKGIMEGMNLLKLYRIHLRILHVKIPTINDSKS
jgi:hypothetical protein